MVSSRPGSADPTFVATRSVRPARAACSLPPAVVGLGAIEVLHDRVERGECHAGDAAA
jgi:hypothetical protein